MQSATLALAGGRQIRMPAGSGRSGATAPSGLTGRLGPDMVQRALVANRPGPRGVDDPPWTVEFIGEPSDTPSERAVTNLRRPLGCLLRRGRS
ncbi:MAG: hypothetical protein ACRDPH_10735 [Marmoricola sp.]